MIRGYSGKVAVVTGAARGLGRALADELAARGCRVVPIDLDTADVSCEKSVQAAAETVKTQYGAIDLLINNAGISISAAFSETASADFDRVVQVNFLGAVYMCRSFLPLFADEGGQILNVVSCFAWLGFPGKTAYAASKGALRSFSDSLRLELAPHGIGVTQLYPGPLATDIVFAGVAESEEARRREHEFLQQRGLPVDRVAKRALNKLVRNPARIVVGRDYLALDWLARLLPASAGKIAGRAASDASRDSRS
jgi:NAD(P)-dependent dehydrogenase (short-subunit alcohol dehydrogenase family)